MTFGLLQSSQGTQHRTSSYKDDLSISILKPLVVGQITDFVQGVRHLLRGAAKLHGSDESDVAPEQRLRMPA